MELVFEVAQLDRRPALEQRFEKPGLVRLDPVLESPPLCVRRVRLTNELVVLFLEDAEDAGLRYLLDRQVSAHRQMDDRRAHVQRVRPFVQQETDLGRPQAPAVG